MSKSVSGENMPNAGSCDPVLNRKQFLELVVRRAGPVGALLIAPKIVDKFLVPPVSAATMYTPNPMVDTTSMNTDIG
jgi:hypothetical protein